MSAISRRYAKALVELGAERKMVERFGEELSRVTSILADNPPLRLLLESPTLAPEKKAGMLADLAAKLQLSQEMRNFLGLLLENDRLAATTEIAADYRRLADELSGIVRARITAAGLLDEARQKAIRAALEQQTGKKVEIRVQADPSLIGGLLVEVGGRVFDGSIKTQLKRIEDKLQKG